MSKIPLERSVRDDDPHVLVDNGRNTTRIAAERLGGRLGDRCDKCGEGRAVSVSREWNARSSRYRVTALCSVCGPQHRQTRDLDRQVELQRVAMRRLLRRR
jgi:hypothetical protein